jgi:UDP-N-acetylglucosamine 4-epimerase
VVKANLNALDPSLNLAGNNVYNIACGHTTTLNTLWETIRELTGATIEAEHRPNRKGDILHSLANVSRAERDLSYTDLVLLKQGLAETIPWYEQQIHGVSKQKELAV